MKHKNTNKTTMSHLRLLLVTIFVTATASATSITFSTSPCRATCGGIAVRHPFGVDEGCGAPQFRGMLNCSTSGELFLTTPSGSYKVESVDYERKRVVVFDPGMSTCSILQPRRQFAMTEVQWALIPPAPDTVVALLNCSIDSPVLNHYKYLCFNFSGHACDELYGACNAFRVFHFLTNSSPPCCFTGYETMRFMSMNILDCTHYTTVINTDTLRGVGPLDWVYGIKLSYSVPETGCERCTRSGGVCGFDTDTEAPICLCSPSSNYTRECAKEHRRHSHSPNRNLLPVVAFVAGIRQNMGSSRVRSGERL